VKLGMKWRALLTSKTLWLLPGSRYLFLIMGGLLLSYCGFVMLDARFYQAYLTGRFHQALKDSRSSATSGELHHPSLAEENRMRAVSLGITGRRGSALGQIEISRIGFAAMVLEGDDGSALRLGVGHIAGTALPGEQGNVVLAGHRDTFFRSLRNIRKGDEITLTTLDGIYRYRVDSIRVVSPQDTKVLDSSASSILTLVTCYPFYFVGPAPKRFVVQARWIPG
jgi:sortase A